MAGSGTPSRRSVIAGSGSLALLSALPARAQSSPIRIIYPFAAGGAGDAICRLIAEELRTTLGRNVIVENRTGANGLVGIKAVMTAPPDGNTILVTTGPTMYLLPMVEKTPSFDPRKDFRPVAILGRFEFAVVAGQGTGAKSYPALTDWLKANPGKASFGVPSFGTIPHFAGIQLAKLSGIRIAAIPYRGGVPMLNDLSGGHLPFGVSALGDVVGLHQGGKLDAVAVMSAKSSPFMPEVPTLKEMGVNLVADAWYGMWLPAGTPDAVADPIVKAVAAALARAEVKDRIMKVGTLPDGGGPDAVTREIEANQAQWRPVVEETGYKMDQ
ncbi:MAG: Bug family tripartite tricarboxylate transporter substrate binding protein [Beijerinckiaceae bacterium]